MRALRRPRLLFLAASLLAGLFAFWHTQAPQAPPISTDTLLPVSPATLLIATVLHYLAPELTDGGAYFQKVIQNADGKMTNYSEELLEAFVRQVTREAPDTLILSGDLTFNGEALSHQRLAEKLQRIEEAGIPVLVIPGNHDLENPMAAQFMEEGYRPAESITAEQFAELYWDFGYHEALARDDASLSYVTELASNLRVLLVDANTVDAPGAVTSQTLSWIKEQLQSAADCGAWVIAASHQNLLVHNRLLTEGYVLEDPDRLLNLYERYPVICNLSGHIHLQHIAESVNGLPEIATSSLAVSPHQYGVLRLEGGETAYETVPVDVATWAGEQGVQDPELLRFDDASRQFFWHTGYRQALRERGDTAEGEALAAFFADVNTAYFAGRMDTAPWDEALFDAWQAGDSFLARYLASIAADGFQDHTAADFAFGGNAP